MQSEEERMERDRQEEGDRQGDRRPGILLCGPRHRESVLFRRERLILVPGTRGRRPDKERKEHKCVF